MRSARRLRTFAAVVIAFNVVATAVAVAVNLPSQFGMVGTDAGAEFLSSGTAISAPPLPVVLLLLVVLLAGRRDWWRWVGLASAYLTALAVGIGGAGELVADPTADTSRAVLLTGGVTWLLIATGLATLATAVVRSGAGNGTDSTVEPAYPAAT